MRKYICNIEYSGAFAAYWMAYVAFSMFCSAYMLDNGFTNTEVGTLLAASNLISVAVQMVIANIIDRTEKVTVIDLSLLFALFIFTAAAVLFLPDGKTPARFAAMLFVLIFHTSMQPLLNSASNTLEEKGMHADYGFCRAMGSLGVSAGSAILSPLITVFSMKAVPAAGMGALIILFFSLLCMIITYRIRGNISRTTESIVRVQKPAVQQNISFRAFMQSHRMFLLLCVGIYLLFLSNQVMNYYMLQMFENVGGDSLDLAKCVTLLGLMEIPTLAGFTFLCSRFSSQLLLKASSVAFVVRIGIAMCATTPLGIYTSMIAQPLSLPLFLPAIVKYINEIMKPGENVRGQSLYVVVTTLSAVTASLAGGIILDISGVKVLLIIGTFTAVLGSVAIVVLADKVRNE